MEEDPVANMHTPHHFELLYWENTHFDCGHGVTEDFLGVVKITEGFLVWSQKFFSTVAWGHGAVSRVPSSSAVHALSESIVYKKKNNKTLKM